MEKRFVWRYEKGWIPFEEDQKHRLSEQIAGSYTLQVDQARSTRDLRDLHDRIILDRRLQDEDKLKLENRIMGLWKLLYYKENDGHDGGDSHGHF